MLLAVQTAAWRQVAVSAARSRMLGFKRLMIRMASSGVPRTRISPFFVFSSEKLWAGWPAAVNGDCVRCQLHPVEPVKSRDKRRAVGRTAKMRRLVHGRWQPARLFS